MSQKYIPSLDGWRAIAIILVIFAHGKDSYLKYASEYISSNAEILSSIGLTGVKIFFGLSGFLITTKLLNEEVEYGNISISSFYIRRCFRILPAAILFMFTIGVLALSGIIDVSLGRWLSTLLFASNYSFADSTWYLGHFWSLAVEEHFYLVWPIIFLKLNSNKRRLQFVVTSMFVIAIWRALDFKYQISGSSSAVFWGRSDIQADGILGGVLIALLYFDQKNRQLIETIFSAKSLWWILFFVFISLELAPTFNWKINFLLLSLKAVLIPLLLLGTVVRTSSMASKLLEHSALRWLGHISYSLYLWQQLFLVWSPHQVADLRTLQLFPINIILALVCAYLSFRLVEKPFIAIGHRVANRF